MGTTLVSMLLLENKTAFIANVGDSRAYMVRACCQSATAPERPMTEISCDLYLLTVRTVSCRCCLELRTCLDFLVHRGCPIEH